MAKALYHVNEPDEILIVALREIADYYETLTGLYSVQTIGKDDIRNQGFSPHTLTTEQMREFAGKVTEIITIDSFWEAVDRVSEEYFELPELRLEIESRYNDFIKQYGRPPLYVSVCLEDKSYDNQPWRETLKLSLDIKEGEDDKIYMYFNGFEDMKTWLWSLENDEMSDNVWCYDSPQHQIEFFDEL